MLAATALLALVPFVAALSVDPLSNANSQGNVTITWVASSTDPDFSVELTNPSFHNTFAIANNVNSGVGTNSITVILPVVPAGDDYTIQLVNPGNITDVFAQSSNFAIGPAVSSSASASSTGSAGSSSSGSFSLNLPTTTVSNAQQTTANAPGASNSAAASGSTSGQTFNGATEMRFSSAGALLAVVAGAAAFAL